MLVRPSQKRWGLPTGISAHPPGTMASCIWFPQISPLPERCQGDHGQKIAQVQQGKRHTDECSNLVVCSFPAVIPCEFSVIVEEGRLEILWYTRPYQPYQKERVKCSSRSKLVGGAPKMFRCFQQSCSTPAPSQGSINVGSMACRFLL